MKDFLIYLLFLFLAPFIAGFFGFLLLLIFSPITNIFKAKHKEKLLGAVLFAQSICATFLTVIFIGIILNIFTLNLTWIFITPLIVFFAINGARRVRASSDQARIFEIHETIADISGLLIGFLFFTKLT